MMADETDLVVSTRERAGTYDAIVSLKPGEPVFAIQGGDPRGPAAVLAWAAEARKDALAMDDRTKADALLHKATNAEQVAWRMREYQAGHVEVETEPARYSDDGPPKPVELDERAARIRVANRGTAIIAEAAALAEQLDQVGYDGQGPAMLRSAIALLRQGIAAIEPREGRERT